MAIKIMSALIIMCALLLQACSIGSHTRSKSPHFSGQLYFNSKAVINAKIMLSIEPDDKYCLQAKKFTTTNNQGEFNLSAISEQYTYVPFADQQLDQWTLCAKYKDNTYSLHTNNRYGAGNVSGAVVLQCDLAFSTTHKFCSSSH